MKLECSAKTLKEVIGQVERISSKNSTLEVLNSVLLVASGKTLKLRSTNLSLGVEIEIPANIEKEGEVAVLSEFLGSTILNLSGDKTILLEKKDNTIVISNKNNSIVLKSIPSEDFPTIPVVEGESFEVPVEEFLEGIRAVYYSSSVSDIKPEISTVYIYTQDDKIMFVATDSFRLAEKSIKNKNNVEIEGILLPYKNIVEVVKILSIYKNEVTISYNKNQISFSFPGFYLTSRIIDGVFPDYRQIIPKESETTAIVLKNDIQNALKLSNIFSDKFNQINLAIKPNSKVFEIYAENKDIGENKTSLEGALKGNDVEIKLNLKYFLDCFQSIPEDSLVLSLNGSSKPLIVKGNSDKTFKYLIMPMNR